MIRLDPSMVVWVYFFLTGSLIVLLWALFRSTKATKEWNLTDHVRRCSYCGHVFVERGSQHLIQCPLCQSYLEEADVDKKVR